MNKINHPLTFKIIKHGSKEYESAVILRENILRKPFGLSFTDPEIAAEKNHIQIVGLQNSEIIAIAVLVPEGLACKMQRVVVKENLANKGIGAKSIKTIYL